MAHSPAFDRGTRFTNYSSIHSAEAFVGDYQVMFTPGASPQLPRAVPAGRRENNIKSTRFARPGDSARLSTVSQSYALPANLPNTSQIVPNNYGALPGGQIRHRVPTDEKQIIASLRALQQEFEDAMTKIESLTRERDHARNQLKLIEMAQGKQRKASSPQKKQRIAQQVDEELFDLSRSEESPKKSPVRQSTLKKVSIARGHEHDPQSALPKNSAQNQFYESVAPHQNAHGSLRNTNQASRQYYRKPTVDDAEQSMLVEDPTAVSNTSKRRRHQALDDNMTSAYIIPDITVAQQHLLQPPVSAEAQQVLHGHEPQHVHDCDVCRRLTSANLPSPNKDGQKRAVAQVTEMLHITHLEDATLRPKISPAQALANVKTQTENQFEHAKQRFTEAWERYDTIQAPLKSRQHATAAKEMSYWQMRMEEYRVNLDNLRDVQEGILGEEGS